MALIKSNIEYTRFESLGDVKISIHKYSKQDNEPLRFKAEFVRIMTNAITGSFLHRHSHITVVGGAGRGTCQPSLSLFSLGSLSCRSDGK